MRSIALLTLTLCFLLSCSAIPTPSDRLDHFNNTLQAHHWQSLGIETSDYTLQAATPLHSTSKDSPVSFPAPTPANRLYIYIEGDGLAWLSRSRPSPNPTPINPLGLKLALAHASAQNTKKPQQAIAYLGRPCQYQVIDSSSACKVKDWTSDRFSAQSVNATNQAIEQLKQRYTAKELVLVGYSGGGAIAALVAAQRQDVVHLITVAGNLDHAFWTQHHKISPLDGSLNPTDYTRDLTAITQTHFVGKLDRIIPPSVSQAYQRHFANAQNINIVIVDDFTHHCCWDQQWPKLLGKVIINSK